jgi:hypothetical protein
MVAEGKLGHRARVMKAGSEAARKPSPRKRRGGKTAT